MNGRSFIDTNILIYLYADNEREKQDVSKEVVNNADKCIISTQTLNEISNVMIKKWQATLETVKTVQSDIRNISEVLYVKEDTIDKAVELSFRYGYSYYDCLVLTSALEGDCAVIYIEDMNDGQLIDGKLKIINPFK